MTEKTCGTCGHCTMIHDRYAVASGVCNIDCRIDSSGHNCLRSVCSTTKHCGDYIERTDSLEQVALDMYRRMTCMAHYECHNSDCECCIDTDCQVKEVFGCIVTGKQTMAIIKQGPILKIFPPAAIPSGSINVEFISKHIGTATQ